MICQNCGENEANVHIIRVVNNEETEQYMCEKCAINNGEFSGANNFKANYADMISGFLGQTISQVPRRVDNDGARMCNICNMQDIEFAKIGKMGCANCYKIFGDLLIPAFKSIQGNTEHKGKFPKRLGGSLAIKKEIQNLREELIVAIQKEEFERAAVIRDRIKDIEGCC